MIGRKSLRYKQEDHKIRKFILSFGFYGFFHRKLIWLTLIFATYIHAFQYEKWVQKVAFLTIFKKIFNSLRIF